MHFEDSTGRTVGQPLWPFGQLLNHCGHSASCSTVVAAVWPIANVLASLTALRQLRLGMWTAALSPSAHSCWQLLPSASPTLPHFDSRSPNRVILTPSSSPPSAPAALSPLPHTPPGSQCRQSRIYRRRSERCRAASARLAAAVGTLIGLQILGLTGLGRFLISDDCHHCLRCLVILSRLELGDFVHCEGNGGLTRPAGMTAWRHAPPVCCRLATASEMVVCRSSREWERSRSETSLSS